MSTEVNYNVPETIRLYICKNSTSNLYITVSKEDLTRIDLTGASVYFTIKRRINDSDAVAIYQKISPASLSILDPTMGLVKVVISATDSLVFPDWYYEYIYDMKIKDALNKTITTSCGTIGVYPAVTKTAL